MSGQLGEGSDSTLVCPPWDVSGNSTWAGKYLNFNDRTVLKNTVKTLPCFLPGKSQFVLSAASGFLPGVLRSAGEGRQQSTFVLFLFPSARCQTGADMPPFLVEARATEGATVYSALSYVCPDTVSYTSFAGSRQKHS